MAKLVPTAFFPFPFSSLRLFFSRLEAIVLRLANALMGEAIARRLWIFNSSRPWPTEPQVSDPLGGVPWLQRFSQLQRPGVDLCLGFTALFTTLWRL